MPKIFFQADQTRENYTWPGADGVALEISATGTAISEEDTVTCVRNEHMWIFTWQHRNQHKDYAVRFWLTPAEMQASDPIHKKIRPTADLNTLPDTRITQRFLYWDTVGGEDKVYIGLVLSSVFHPETRNALKLRRPANAVTTIDDIGQASNTDLAWSNTLQPVSPTTNRKPDTEYRFADPISAHLDFASLGIDGAHTVLFDLSEHLTGNNLAWLAAFDVTVLSEALTPEIETTPTNWIATDAYVIDPLNAETFQHSDLLTLRLPKGATPQGTLPHFRTALDGTVASLGGPIEIRWTAPAEEASGALSTIDLMPTGEHRRGKRTAQISTDTLTPLKQRGVLRARASYQLDEKTSQASSDPLIVEVALAAKPSQIRAVDRGGWYWGARSSRSNAPTLSGRSLALAAATRAEHTLRAWATLVTCKNMARFETHLCAGEGLVAELAPQLSPCARDTFVTGHSGPLAKQIAFAASLAATPTCDNRRFSKPSAKTQWATSVPGFTSVDAIETLEKQIWEERAPLNTPRKREKILDTAPIFLCTDPLPVGAAEMKSNNIQHLAITDIGHTSCETALLEREGRNLIVQKAASIGLGGSFFDRLLVARFLSQLDPDQRTHQCDPFGPCDAAFNDTRSLAVVLEDANFANRTLTKFAINSTESVDPTHNKQDPWWRAARSVMQTFAKANRPKGIPHCAHANDKLFEQLDLKGTPRSSVTLLDGLFDLGRDAANICDKTRRPLWIVKGGRDMDVTQINFDDNGCASLDIPEGAWIASGPDNTPQLLALIPEAPETGVYATAPAAMRDRILQQMCAPLQPGQYTLARDTNRDTRWGTGYRLHHSQGGDQTLRVLRAVADPYKAVTST